MTTEIKDRILVDGVEVEPVLAGRELPPEHVARAQVGVKIAVRIARIRVNYPGFRVDQHAAELGAPEMEQLTNVMEYASLGLGLPMPEQPWTIAGIEIRRGDFDQGVRIAPKQNG